MATNDPEVVAERDARVAVLYRLGLMEWQIAQEVGITQRSVQRAKRRLGIRTKEYHHPWTDEEHQKAVEMLAGGVSYREVAITLGRSESTVSRHCRGLSRCTPADGLNYHRMLKMLEAL